MSFLARISTAAVLAVVLVNSAAAQPVYLPPIGVRVTGYVETVPDGVKPQFTWKIIRATREYTLFLTDLLVLKGNLTALDITGWVEPYWSRFELAGTEAAMDQFVSIPPRELVVIFAYLRLYGGANYFVLDRIEPLSAPTPAPTP